MNIYEFNPRDAERFAAEKGIHAVRRGDELQFRRCPYCGNRTDDKNTFSINLRTGQFKCLRASCGAHGNMISLAKDFQFSLGAEVDEYYRRQKRFRDMAKYPRPIPREPAVAYLESRGISRAVTERYGITTQKEHDNVIVFPFFDENGKMQFVKYRKADFDKTKDKNKEWCEANCKPILFGMDQCNDEKKTLILTEGQIDSLSVIEAGIENAVSVPTGAKGFTWVPYCWDFLGRFDTLIVFGDHENGKITLLDEMKSRFRGTVKHVRSEDYLDCKDANDLLRKHGKEAVRAAVQGAVPVENRKILRLAEIERVNLFDLEKFSTGIVKLDRTLGGGFYMGQLIVLTGERGEGKSTFAGQLATMALKAGHSIFFYSGELMSYYFKAWLDQQIAGPEYINSMLTNYGEYSYRIQADAQKAIGEWYWDKMWLYNNDILADDDAEEETLLETVEDAIMQYGCRVIFLDNLMTAMDDDVSSDIYRQQTNFTKKLARLAKKFNALIVLIAHPKKRGNFEFSNDDVAGSANITNLADVVLRFMRPKATEDEPNPPDARLQVWKNRLKGRTEKDIGLYYDESSRRLSEDHDFSWKLGWEPKENQADEFTQIGFDDMIPFE